MKDSQALSSPSSWRFAVTIGIALLVLVILGVSTAWQLGMIRDNRRDVTETYDTLRHLHAVQAHLAQTEAAASDYRLTGHLRSVEPFAQASGQLTRDLHELQVLLADDPVQRDALTELAQRIDQYQTALKANLPASASDRATEDRPDRAEPDATDNGSVRRQQSRAIGAALGQMMAHEQTLLREREQAARSAFFWSLGLGGTVWVISGVLVLFAIMLVQREFGIRSQIEHALRGHTVQFQSLVDVAARTASTRDEEAVARLIVRETRRLLQARRACLRVQWPDGPARDFLDASVSESSEDDHARVELLPFLDPPPEAGPIVWSRNEGLRTTLRPSRTPSGSPAVLGTRPAMPVGRPGSGDWAQAGINPTAISPPGGVPVSRGGRDAAAESSERRTELPEPPVAEAVTGVLSIPLVGQGRQLIGRLVVANRFDGEFSHFDLLAVSYLARIGVVALENARLNQQLRVASSRKDTFLAILGHELRNPLASLVSGVEALQMLDDEQSQSQPGRLGPPPAELRQQVFAAIRRQSRHMNRIIEDLLDVSRVVQGKLRIRQRAVDLRPIVEQTVSDFLNAAIHVDAGAEPSSDGSAAPWSPVPKENARPRLPPILRIESEMPKPVAPAGPAARPASMATVTVTVPPNPVPVSVDATRIGQCLTNLLTNAQKFTEPTEWIDVTLDLDEANQQAVLTVRDSGVGLSAEEQATIFEMFHQVESTVHRNQGGLGLGLTLVRGVVALHEGTIQVASDGPGRGTTFTIRLPLIAGPVSNPPISSNAQGNPAVARGPGQEGTVATASEIACPESARRDGAPCSPNSDVMAETNATPNRTGGGGSLDNPLEQPVSSTSPHQDSDQNPRQDSSKDPASMPPSLRVLLIDDRRDAILPMRLLLQREGHTVETAGDGETALERLTRDVFDVVFCDIGLPGDKSGYDVAAEVCRGATDRVKPYLVAVTGYGTPQEREASRLAGFDYHLTKPVSLTELRSVVIERPTFPPSGEEHLPRVFDTATGD